MNSADLPSRNAKLHALAPDQALALDLPIGSSVRALAGVTWLTQEGCADDFVLAPGEAFHVAARGRIVVNGLRAPAVVLAELASAAPFGAATVAPECRAAIEAEARRVRGREIARLAVQLGRSVARAVRRVGRVVRRSVNMLSMRRLGAGVGVPGDHNRGRTQRLRCAPAGAAAGMENVVDARAAIALPAAEVPPRLRPPNQSELLAARMPERKKNVNRLDANAGPARAVEYPMTCRRRPAAMCAGVSITTTARPRSDPHPLLKTV